MTSPARHGWKYEYDSYGDRTGETDPEGNKQTWGYNEDSQGTSTVSPRGHVDAGATEANFKTTIERDAQGRPVKITDPLGQTTKYTYERRRQPGKRNEPDRPHDDLHLQRRRRPTKNEQPNGDTTETEYDALGQVTSQTDGNKQTTKYKRNAPRRGHRSCQPTQPTRRPRNTTPQGTSRS